MVSKSNILKSLNKLDKIFRDNPDLKVKSYISKLALLELCGWLEESMDDIINKVAKKKLKESVNQNYVENNIIKSTNGFSYNGHFRYMLIRLVGIIDLEKIERKITITKIDSFRGRLGNLKDKRDSHAHTFLKGTITTIQPPSTTIVEFNNIFKDLKIFEKQIKKYVT